ncbi:MAG: BMP family ABC transporter substrate-binding protein [Ruminococcus sp.]|nr:BMP family ABC transporter substrate-binding protein [Candidatus Apopatosoma intestinale]
MKKLLSVIFAILMMTSILFSAVSCGENPAGPNAGQSQTSGVADIHDGKFRVALLINGDLGDMSFWDSANEGMLRFQKDHPEADVKIVEMGSSDPTVYESTLAKTAAEAYDLIIVGTTDMREPLQRLVKKEKYADRRFVIFDTEIKDGKAADYKTVHSIMFNQNEGGYLAGVLASLMSLDAGSANTAFIGGAPNDIINDFASGFMQGVRAVNAERSASIGAFHSFIGDFSDSPKGKSLAETYYSGNDVSVLFAAASQAGIGCVEAATLTGHTIIGVDSDQYAFYKDSNPAKAAAIVTSIEKRVGDTLYEVCEKFMADTLTYGDLEVLGIKDGKIGYVDNDNFKALVSEANRAYLADVAAKIASGELKIESGLKRYTTSAELTALYDSLDPTKK